MMMIMMMVVMMMMTMTTRLRRWYSYSYSCVGSCRVEEWLNFEEVDTDKRTVIQGRG